MNAFKRVLIVGMLLLMLVSAAYAEKPLQVSVADEQGQAAQVTGFEAEGVKALWVQMPEGSNLEALHIDIQGGSEGGYSPASGSVIAAADAGSTVEGAAYFMLTGYTMSGEIVDQYRVYVSFSPYQPVKAPEVRNARSVGRWARFVEDAELLAAPEQDAASFGKTVEQTVVYMLFTCRAGRTEYACVRFAGKEYYVRADSVQTLSEAVSSAFDAQMLSDRSETDEVLFARTGYSARIRSVLGTADNAILETAPVGTFLIVLSQVNYSQTLYDLIYRPENGTIGFVHDSQLIELSDEEAAAALSGTETFDMNPFSGSIAQACSLLAYPSAEAEITAALKAGTAVTVYTEIETPDGLFYLVGLDEQLGYVAAADVVKDTNAEQDPLPVNVTADVKDGLYGSGCRLVVREAMLYYEPSFNVTTVERVSRKDSLTCLEQRDGWIRVRAADGKTGWMPAEFAVPGRLGYSSEDDAID